MKLIFINWSHGLDWAEGRHPCSPSWRRPETSRRDCCITKQLCDVLVKLECPSLSRVEMPLQNMTISSDVNGYKIRSGRLKPPVGRAPPVPREHLGGGALAGTKLSTQCHLKDRARSTGLVSAVIPVTPTEVGGRGGQVAIAARRIDRCYPIGHEMAQPRFELDCGGEEFVDRLRPLLQALTTAAP